MKELLEILESNARISTAELASMLKISEDEVKAQIALLESENVIMSYSTLINWERFGEELVTAFIEINLTPQREVGFDALAERICRFDEVRSVYLMSGNFDLLVVVQGKSLKEISNFVAKRVSTIEGVTQTRSHFLLKEYKKDGIILENEEQDRRLVIVP
ncbi:MAG: Lrp/AsnC family transcriptional regulator [Selenomonadaceae bacterium]|nr:Lrp/AsnC family transcriptional regulator [Selenomonadaceae bacterium]